MTSQQQLLQHLDIHQIAYQLYTHQPLFTCQQALQVVKELNMPGAGIKNLFVQDDKKRVYLIVAVHTTRIDLKQFKNQLVQKICALQMPRYSCSIWASSPAR